MVYDGQAIQLLVCDWLLSTRTEMWQRESASGDDDASDDQEVSSSTIPSVDLAAFQQDLASLRKLAHSLKAAMPRVGTFIVSFRYKSRCYD